MDTMTATPPPPFLGRILKLILGILLLAGILAIAVQHLGGGQSPKIRPNCDPNEVYKLAADEAIRLLPPQPYRPMVWQMVRTVNGETVVLSELKMQLSSPSRNMAAAITSKGVTEPQFVWIASINTFYGEGQGRGTRLLLEGNRYLQEIQSPYPRYFASANTFSNYIAACSMSVDLGGGNWLLWP